MKNSKLIYEIVSVSLAYFIGLFLIFHIGEYFFKSYSISPFFFKILPLISVSLIYVPPIIFLSKWMKISILKKWGFPSVCFVVVLLFIAFISRIIYIPLFNIPAIYTNLLNSNIIIEVYNAEVWKSGICILLLNILYYAVVIPILEELLFRRIIQTFLLRYLSVPISILLASVIFALSHFTIVNFFAIIFWGILLGVIYYKTTSLWSSVILHFFINLIMLFVKFKIVSFNYIYIAIYVFVTLVLIILLKNIGRINLCTKDRII